MAIRPSLPLKELDLRNEGGAIIVASPENGVLELEFGEEEMLRGDCASLGSTDMEGDFTSEGEEPNLGKPIGESSLRRGDEPDRVSRNDLREFSDT